MIVSCNSCLLHSANNLMNCSANYSFRPTTEEIELPRDNVPVDINPAYESSVKKPAILISSNPAYGQFSSITELSAPPYEIPLNSPC